MKHVVTRTYPDLKSWRQAKGYGQREAAKYLQISQTFYGRLERRAQTARGPKAKIIMTKTGVPLEVLVGAA